MYSVCLRWGFLRTPHLRCANAISMELFRVLSDGGYIRAAAAEDTPTGKSGNKKKTAATALEIIAFRIRALTLHCLPINPPLALYSCNQSIVLAV